jgi:hypothetical protein
MAMGLAPPEVEPTRGQLKPSPRGQLDLTQTFIADRFAEYVDGAERRWGKGVLRRGEVDRAYFDLESRGGVMIVRSKVVEALYLTQPEVDLRKANKEWAA